MKIKAENLKPGHILKIKGEPAVILTALKRFYKNGRAKMEVTAKTSFADSYPLTLKADTLITIYVFI